MPTDNAAKTFCWAQSLGNCGGGRSGEHLISESILRLFTRVTVVGFPWCEKPKEVGASALTANHLCRNHNSSLSPIDDTALRFFTVLRNQFASAVPPVKLPVEIAGLQLERWFLKTAINLILAHGQTMKWPNSGNGGALPETLVRIAFGSDVSSPPAGLYFFGGQGQKVESIDGIRMVALLQDNDSIGGLQWYFRGLSFISWMEIKEQPVWIPFSGGTLLRAGDPGSPLNYHPTCFDLKRGGRPFCEINISWPETVAESSTSAPPR